MASKNQEIGRHAARAALICVKKRSEIHYSQDMTLRWTGIRNDVRLPEVPKFADSLHGSFIIPGYTY